jgi:hypothetical protein
MKLSSNPPRFPFFKGEMLSKGFIKPLVEKEGQGEICLANFRDATLNFDREMAGGEIPAWLKR